MKQREREASTAASASLGRTPGARWRRRATAALLALSVVTAGTIVGQVDSPAYAADYPTWEDVQAARSNADAKAGEVARITALLAQIEQQVVETQAAAEARGAEYQAAQQAFDDASFAADQLQSLATAAQATANESKLRAGQLAARLSRTGGDDLTASLFFDGGSADKLLSQLGMASKITDQSEAIYARAFQDQNLAQSRTDQANVAKDALKALADAAQQALQAANDAADAAAAALAEQQDNQAVLQAQLAVLNEDRDATEADYNAGVAARAAAAAALLAAQQAALAQQAAELRAAQAAAAPGQAAPAPIVPGTVSPSGWSLPASGRISSPFGYRVNPYSGAYALHAGVDIGASCGKPIFAGHSGTVVYSGPNGGYGNYIQIANGDGVATAYGHIVNGGLLVPRGAQVQTGQLIALVGSTGGSTGCHLHYEVRINGSAIDPVPFMSARGVQIG